MEDTFHKDKDLISKYRMAIKTPGSEIPLFTNRLPPILLAVTEVEKPNL